MRRLPLLSAKELIKALQKMGFEKIRQEGGHVFLRHPDGRTTVVPVHTKDIDRGLLTKIINKDLKVGREEFLMYV